MSAKRDTTKRQGRLVPVPVVEPDEERRLYMLLLGCFTDGVNMVGPFRSEPEAESYGARLYESGDASGYEVIEATSPAEYLQIIDDGNNGPPHTLFDEGGGATHEVNLGGTAVRL